MNWIALCIFAWVFLGLELGFKQAISLGPHHIAPSFMFVLLSLVAMSAPARAASVTSLILGLLMDMTNSIATKNSGPAGVVIGPHVLAYFAGVQLILSLRGIMIRRNPLTLGFLAMVGSLVGAVVLVAVFTLRSLFDPIEWHAATELWTRLAGGAYTGGVGAIMALVLVPLSPFLGLQSPQQRRFARTN